MSRAIPWALHPAYEWTRAAGELQQLTRLADRPRKLAAYARDSAANAAEHGVTDVDAGALMELAEWLANR